MIGTVDELHVLMIINDNKKKVFCLSVNPQCSISSHSVGTSGCFYLLKRPNKGERSPKLEVFLVI